MATCGNVPTCDDSGYIDFMGRIKNLKGNKYFHFDNMASLAWGLVCLVYKWEHRLPP